MEPGSFNFQQSVTDYIRSIKQKGGLSSSDESELLSHMIDSTESLLQKGLSQEEAFLIASRRLGHTEELSREYSKVNTVLVTDKLWAYMLLGFSLLTSLQWLYMWGYRQFYEYLSTCSNIRFARLLYIGVNLLVCVVTWSVLKWGHAFSAWLQRNTEKRPWLTILLSLIMPALVLLGGPVIRYKGVYPQAILNDRIAEYSHYLGIISMVLVLLLSVFSIANPGRVTFRRLFANRSPVYIILFGIIIEILAATTRVFNDIPIISVTVLFGMVYMAGAFCIAYFNEKKPLLSLSLLSLFGLVVEIWGGLLADRDRGNTHYTIYFVGAIVLGVSAGYLLARVASRRAIPGL